MGLKPKFIYFDLDDTLLNHKQAERNALLDIHHHFDLFSNSSADRLVDIYQKVNSNQWSLYSQAKVSRKELQRNRFERTLQELGLDDSCYAEIGAQYMKFYRNHWQWIDGAEGVFQQLRDNYEVGILTNGFAETQKLKFERFDLYNQAKHLVISEEVGVMKPHPKVFEHATDITDYQPGEILYIGDSYHSDVIGGRDFGWNVAWFTANGDEDQKKKANFRFKHFDDLLKYIEV
ncbi:MAG: HAD-IA family hydrolase [Balneolaceae bacterium]|nr:HAD-IA family hydrolase [Balneolaceae bacterium]